MKKNLLIAIPILVIAFMLAMTGAFSPAGTTTALAWDCSNYKFQVLTNGTVQAENLSTSNETSQLAAVKINNVIVATLSVPAMSKNTSWTTIGTVTVPTSTYTWQVKGSLDCGNSGTNVIHTVTWATNADCTGWSATYSIDGGTPVTYDSGVWSDPYSLETANPKAFTVPEVSGYIYDHPNSPSVTINEPTSCLKQHIQVTLCHATPPATAAQGWNLITIDDDAVVKQGHDNHAMDIIPAFTYWDKDGVHNYPGKNLATIFGWGVTGQQVLDNGCVIPPQHHQVTWATNPDCNGWNATYAIDGGAPVVYDSGVWSNPYVLETANPKAFTVPEVPGDIYDHPNAPSVTVNEPANCQATHKVTYGSDNTCKGWDAWYPIDGDSQVIYASGSWTNQYVLETANVPAEDIPIIAGQLYDNPHKDGFVVNESAECLVVLNHNAVISSDPTCEGWSASFSSSDGGIGTPTTPTSGVWVDPYALESATVSYHVVWPDGYTKDVSAQINEPESCLHTKTSVTITPGPCKYQKGQDFSLTLGDGLTFEVFKKGDNPATATPVVSMTKSGKFHLPKGSYFWIAKAAQGYDIVGPDHGNINVNDKCNAPPPSSTEKIGLAMLYCTDNSLCYDKGMDGVCWIKYSLAPGQMFSTANAVQWCDLGPGKTYDPNIMKVYVDPVSGRSFMDEVFLGYPFTKQCWGPDDKGNCVLDQLLAKFNWAHGTHYQYGWLFPGFGGH